MNSNELAEKIAKISLEQFNSLPKTGKPLLQEFTVLSCLIQQENDQLEVIALGTGTKCIGQGKMSPTGDILNDSHAEIICRRSFLKYLYSQLNLCLKGNKSIFLKEGDIFKVRPGVLFHFFTTQVPCGDAAIIDKFEMEDQGQVLQPKRKLSDCNESSVKRVKLDDVFRTGAKCISNDERQDKKLPGIEYHCLGAVRTKPGRGDPTLSVSCSDKIAKWIHLGLQGALLSVFIPEPIYLNIFVLSSNTPFCPKAIERAFYGRLGKVELCKPYYTSQVKVIQSNVEFQFGKSEDKVPCPSSICWFKGSNVEVAVNGKKQGVTKKNLMKRSGRLKICKAEAFENFSTIYEQLNGQELGTRTYLEAKQSSIKYYEGWEELKKSFGVWTTKPKDLSNFTLQKIQ